jgi:Fe-S-cluster-containing dehydrogenase component
LVNRRNFIKAVSGTAVGLGVVSLAGLKVVEPVLGQSADKPSSSATNFGMVIDVGACVGCRRCVYACIKENNIGRDSNIQWIRVFQMEPGTTDMDSGDMYYDDAPVKGKWYLPTQCMQCKNPSCVSVCPVKATWKDPDGIIVIDYNKCIGCKYCMVACPYWARNFNWKKPEVPTDEVNPDGGTYGLPFASSPVRPAGVVEKCTFCAHRTRKGLNPRCVEVCPMGARHFGDLNDPNSEVSKLIQTKKQVFRLKESLGTEPQIYYVY